TAPVRDGGDQAGRGGRGGRGGGRGGAGATGPAELFVRTGGQETRVAAMDAGIGGVAWSPDGSYLLFTSGGGQIRHEQTPDYSGTKIIYTINENVQAQSYAVAMPTSGDSAKPVQLPPGGFGGRRWIDGHRYLADRTIDFKRRTTSIVDVA